jgi:adenine-specific DNA-methyltransferase
MANNTYYTNQLITYLGNKRLLLKNIESIVQRIIREFYYGVSREDIIAADIFSGSGIVARMLKTYVGELIVNDFEPYSKVINECYLTNRDDFNEEKYDELLKKINEYPKITNGLIRQHYSPRNDKEINFSDRCFYTNSNAEIIDTYRQAIRDVVPLEMQKYFLAPLIYEASVHVNTGGMFKGFYKDKNTGVGKFGGTNSDSLKRILGEIRITKPILSDYDSKIYVYCEDSNVLVKKLKKIDITYVDSPYNQHPYGSNYFMLNTILDYKAIDERKISKVSGIPEGWKKSDYYVGSKALNAMEDLISNLDSRWIIISYSSGGLISYDDFMLLLKKHGSVEPHKIKYSLLKSGRNRKHNKAEVNEYIFVLRKGDFK